WTQLSSVDWNGRDGSLWYAINSNAGNESVTTSSPASDLILLEYPPATFDERATAQFNKVYPFTQFNCCSAFAPLSLTTSQPQELLIAWVASNAPAKYPIAGFVSEDTGTTMTVADQIVTPGSYTANIPQGVNAAWGASLVAFTLTGPPPPPKLISVNAVLA